MWPPSSTLAASTGGSTGVGLLMVDLERRKGVRAERDDVREHRTDADRFHRSIDRRQAAGVGHDVRQLVVGQVEELGRRHRRRLAGAPHAVTDGTVPIGGSKSASDTAGAARQIRRGPVADDGLVDEHVTAEVGAVTSFTAHPCLDQVLSARDRARQRGCAEIHSRQRIRRRRAAGQTFGAERLDLGRAEWKRNRKRRVVGRPVLLVFPARDDTGDAGRAEREHYDHSENPANDLQHFSHRGNMHSSIACRRS